MSKSVREMAEEVVLNEYRKTIWGDRVAGRIVDALAAAGLLATHALLECGDACIAHFKQHPDSDRLGRKPTEACSMSTKAGRALLAEREGRTVVTETRGYATLDTPDIAAAPSTAEVDAKLYEVLDENLRTGFGWSENVLPAHAACRKAREPRPIVRMLRVTYHDGTSLRQYEVNAEQGAEIARILRLEAK